MLEIRNDDIDQKFEEVIQDITKYKDNIEQEIQTLKDCKSQILGQIEHEKRTIS